MSKPLCLLTCFLPLDETVTAWLADLHLALARERLDLVVLAHDVRVPTPFPVLTLPILLRDFTPPTGTPADTTPVSWNRTALRLARRDRAWIGAGTEDLVPFLEGHAACEHALRQLLAILQPALVLTWGSSLPPSLVLRSCCDQLQVPTFVLERGLLPETLMLDQRGHGALSDLNTCLLAAHLGDTPDDEACYRQIRDYYQSRRASKYPQAASLSPADFQARYNPDNRATLAFLGQYDHGAGLTPPDSPGARLESPFFTSTADCLVQLCRVLADHPGRRLLFKPHPLDPTDYSPAESPATHVLRDVSLFDLFEYADVLAFTSSTSIFEALLYEKPCVLLARSQLSHKGATYELQNLADLGSLLDHAFARHDFDTLRQRQRRWVQAICRHYLVGLKPDVPTRLHLPDLARFLAQNAAPTQPPAPLATLLPHARLALPASRLVSSLDPVVQASSLHAPDPTSPPDPPSLTLDPRSPLDLAAARGSLGALQAARTEVARLDQLARERDQTIHHLDKVCRERQATIEHLDRLCRERDATIRDLHARAAVAPRDTPAPQSPRPASGASADPNPPPGSAVPSIPALPTDRVDVLQRAQAACQQGDLPAARTILEAAIARSPEDASLHEVLGNLEWQAGQYAPALAAYRQAALRTPGSAEAHLKVALAAWNLGDLPACDTALAATLALECHHPGALELLGSLRLQQARFAEAGGCFERLLDGDPNHVPALLGLAKCEYAQGDFIAARLNCLRVLKLDPQHALAAENLRLIDARTRSPRPRGFLRRSHRRFFWYKLPHSDFSPPIYSFLDDQEWSLLEAWFEETEQRSFIGEATIPFMSLLQALIMGNRLSRIVQLGTYSGYSSLLLGFMLRKMGIRSGFLSADVDETTTRFAQDYVRRARLEDYVRLVLCDSKAPSLVQDALEHFGGIRPQLVIIDSSHERDQTLVELDLWYDALIPGGFLVLHDTSPFAQQWDATKRGGVKAALDHWTQRNPAIPHLNIDCTPAVDPASPSFVYQDGNGVALVYKTLDRRPDAAAAGCLAQAPATPLRP